MVGLVGGGVKAIKGVGFITFMSGLAFALPQILVAKYVGAELPAIAGSIVCILVTALLAKRHKDVPEYSASTGDIAKHSAGELLQACAPFILVFVFVLSASSLFPAVNSLLNYGLALGGPHGVASVINELNDELKIDMQLTGCKTIEDVKHARLTDFQYASDTKPSSTDPRVRKPYPVTAVNQIKSEPDAATGASHH